MSASEDDPDGWRQTAWRSVRMLSLTLALLAPACSDSGSGDRCELEDLDGIIGGNYTFVLRIQDDGFDPIILTAQNDADVTLMLVNEGSGDNGFSVDCLPTPNDDGCPTSSCFPEDSRIEPIAPGESATVEFDVPEVEGIYTYRTLPDDDARTGQFIVQ